MDNRCESCGHFKGCYLECELNIDFDTSSIYKCRCPEGKTPIIASMWPFVLTAEEMLAWSKVSDRMREHLAALIKEREPFIAQIDQRKTYRSHDEI